MSNIFLFPQAITVLVKNVKKNTISETQLQVLLGYAEEDIYDQSRQATAFSLLKVLGQNTHTACCNMILIRQR